MDEAATKNRTRALIQALHHDTIVCLNETEPGVTFFACPDCSTLEETIVREGEGLTLTWTVQGGESSLAEQVRRERSGAWEKLCRHTLTNGTEPGTLTGDETDSD